MYCTGYIGYHMASFIYMWLWLQAHASHVLPALPEPHRDSLRADRDSWPSSPARWRVTKERLGVNLKFINTKCEEQQIYNTLL